MQVEYTVDCVVEWEETEDIPLLKLEAILVKRGRLVDLHDDVTYEGWAMG